MAGALSPEQAIAYVRELSADVRAVVVLAADGSLLAGPPALREPAAALAGIAHEGVWRTDGGVAFAARTATHAVVAVAGPLSLTGPTALDVRAAAGALGGVPQPAGAQAPPPVPSPPDSAAQRAIRALMTAF